MASPLQAETAPLAMSVQSSPQPVVAVSETGADANVGEEARRKRQWSQQPGQHALTTTLSSTTPEIPAATQAAVASKMNEARGRRGNIVGGKVSPSPLSEGSQRSFGCGGQRSRCEVAGRVTPQATISMEDATRQIAAAGGKVGGSVVSFNVERGFGHIRMDGGEDHFVHAANLLDCNTLAIGARVTFVAEYDQQKAKPIAKQVSGAYFDPNRSGGANTSAVRHRVAVSGAQVEDGGRSAPTGEQRARDKRERERAERRTREEVLRKRTDAPSVSQAAAASLCPAVAVYARPETHTTITQASAKTSETIVRVEIRVRPGGAAPPPRLLAPPAPSAAQQRERVGRRTRDEPLRKRAEVADAAVGSAAAVLCPSAAVRTSFSLEGTMVRLTIRLSEAWRAPPPPPLRPPPPPAVGSATAALCPAAAVVKKAQCRFFAQGRCRHGSSCRFAHHGYTPAPTAAPLAPSAAQQRSAPRSRSWGRGRRRSRSCSRERKDSRSRSRSRERSRSRSTSDKSKHRRSDRDQGESGPPLGRLQSERARGLELARGKTVKDVTGRLDVLPAQVGFILGGGGSAVAALKQATGVTSVRVQNKDSARPFVMMTGHSRDAVALAEKVVRALLRAAVRRARGEAFRPVQKYIGLLAYSNAVHFRGGMLERWPARGPPHPSAPWIQEPVPAGRCYTGSRHPPNEINLPGLQLCDDHHEQSARSAGKPSWERGRHGPTPPPPPPPQCQSQRQRQQQRQRQ